MSEEAKAEWQNRWTIDGNAIGAGGQGYVYPVTDADGVVGALKLLRNQNETILRKRMRREADILQMMNGKGTPQLLDTNATRADWADKDHDLFIVMERIAGKNLREYCNGPIALDDAVAIAKQLLETIATCHSLDVHHRDLKPENIIIRAADGQAILVDFGISWSDDDEIHTPIGVELGNRFYRLPEHGAGADVADPRSDIAMIVGLLFFMVSGRNPGRPSDEHNRKPHVVHGEALPAQLISSTRWPKLRRIFDIGLDQNIALRFQSAADLMTRLDNLDPDVADKRVGEFEEAARLLDDLRQSQVMRDRAQREDLLRKGSQKFLTTVTSMLGPTGIVCGGSGPDFDQEGIDRLAFFGVPSGTAHPQIRFQHACRTDGAIVDAFVGLGTTEQLRRYYSGSLSDPDGLLEAAEREGRVAATFVLKGIAVALQRR